MQNSSSLKNKLSAFFKRFKHEKNESENKPKSSLKKTAKILLWSSGILLALLLNILIFLDFFVVQSLSLSSIFTGVDITVENLDISLTKGEVLLEDLRISNPDGFSKPALLELGKFYVSLELSSLFSREIIIHDLQVERLFINPEVDRNGKFNILELAKNFTDKEPDTDTAPPPPEPDAPAEPVKIWIKKFQISDIRIIWHDVRESANINGFGLGVTSIAGSTTDGNLNISGLQIDNPDGYEVDKMLTETAIEIKFTPETLFSDHPEITLVKISNFNFTSEFNAFGEFNVSSVVASISQLFQADENEPASEQPTPQPDNKKSPPQELKDLSLIIESGAIYILDDRLNIPAITIPLNLQLNISQNKKSITSDDVLDFLKQQVEKLETLSNSEKKAGDLLNDSVKDSLRIFDFSKEEDDNSVIDSVFNIFNRKSKK